MADDDTADTGNEKVVMETSNAQLKALRVRIFATSDTVSRYWFVCPCCGEQIMHSCTAAS